MSLDSSFSEAPIKGKNLHIQELSREAFFEPKAETPSFSINLLSPVHRKFINNEKLHKRVPSSRGSPYMKTSSESLMKVFNPTKASLGTSIEEFSKSLEIEPKVCESEAKLTTTLDEGSISDEIGELGMLPVDIVCPRCEFETYTVVSVEMPTLSVWERLCCVGDLINCCTSPREWNRYQEVFHRCKMCDFCVGKVNPL